MLWVDKPVFNTEMMRYVIEGLYDASRQPVMFGTIIMSGLQREDISGKEAIKMARELIESRVAELEKLKGELANKHGISHLPEEDIEEVFNDAWEYGFDQETLDVSGVIDCFGEFAEKKLKDE